MSTMWHSACDDLCPPLPRPPPVPPCCCFQVQRVLCMLDPPCTYSKTLNITLPTGVSSAFLRDHPVSGHARSGLSHDDPRLLDPPCTYSPTLNIILPAGASAAFLRDNPDPATPTLGCPMMLCLPLEMLIPSFSIFLLTNLPTATKLHPIRLSLYFKTTST